MFQMFSLHPLYYMKRILLIAILFVAGVAAARPVVIPTLEELMAQSPVVIIIHPESIRQTEDRPDDESFGTRDLKNYQPLETTCSVITTLKGTVSEKNIKIVHFAYADPKPEFNGGLMMSFLFDPVRLVTFPALPDGKPDLSQNQAYGVGRSEYLAFLRRLPDGRYAAATGQYDAAAAFRLLSFLPGAQRYHYHPAAKPSDQPKK